jgi:nicotinamide mononucleotide transporter
MALQVVYIVLGVLGWYWWLHGGENKTALHVVKADRGTLIVVCALVIAGTTGMTVVLERIKDAAPFLDALTTAISLGSQYLITKKMIENWYGWIVADVIYVYLYWVKHTPLTAILYFGFLIMCVLGLIAWNRARQQADFEASLEPLHG